MRAITLLVLSLTIISCGQQLVEYPLPAGKTCHATRDSGVCLIVVDGAVKTDGEIVPRPDGEVKTDLPIIQPDLPVIQPDLPVAQPDVAVVRKPDLFIIQPDVAVVRKPDLYILQPDVTVARKPDATVVDPCIPLPVTLGAAGDYAVLAGSTVTNTGPSVVTGDLGLSPGTAVTGFPPGTLIGAQHIGDSTVAQAKLDLTTAYNDAAGRTKCVILVAGNLGGQTLSPGLFKSTSSLAVSSGDLTLDAGGNPNAVWIFQMASTWAMTPGRKVILAGGAQAKNIWFQVGSSATLGTTSIMYGTILADQSITIETGAVLNGRALARIAAVTLDSCTVTKP